MFTFVTTLHRLVGRYWLEELQADMICLCHKHLLRQRGWGGVPSLQIPRREGILETARGVSVGMHATDNMERAGVNVAVAHEVLTGAARGVGLVVASLACNLQ
jgi:hypothetical protein